MTKFKVGDKVRANRSCIIIPEFVGEVGTVTELRGYQDDSGNGVVEVEYPGGDRQVVWPEDDKLELVESVSEDTIEKPTHYNSGGIECIDAIQAALTEEEFKGYLKGNILKYNWREGYKNGVEDLEKSKVYLTWLINFIREGKIR